MSTCAQPCAGCSCKHGGSNANSLNDIEDYQKAFNQAQQRNAELEDIIQAFKAKGSKPDSMIPSAQRLRSQAWFNDVDEPLMTSIYVERYQNYGITREEIMSGKPIIGIAQTGSDLAPCNRHHLQLAKRVRDGIRSAGGIAFEFPTHPIQETGRRPTASLDRNLAYLSLVEILHGYPIDGVVLLTGCDKTTPACIMAAATMVRLPHLLTVPLLIRHSRISRPYVSMLVL